MHVCNVRLDLRIQDICKTWSVPGAAVSIVTPQGIAYRHLFGVRDIESGAPVTEKTVFQVGSITKSFTSALAAVLEDRKLLSIDTPVCQYIDGFSMYDACAAKTITLGNFLNQNSGLPSHNLYWHGSHLTRQQLFDGIRHLQNKWNYGQHWFHQKLN